MNDIIQSCIIMHNMIIQDENGLELEPFFDKGLGEAAWVEACHLR
jgi:hypothetical protein